MSNELSEAIGTTRPAEITTSTLRFWYSLAADLEEDIEALERRCASLRKRLDDAIAARQADLANTGVRVLPVINQFQARQLADIQKHNHKHSKEKG